MLSCNSLLTGYSQNYVFNGIMIVIVKHKARMQKVNASCSDDA